MTALGISDRTRVVGFVGQLGPVHLSLIGRCGSA
jgi:hypothetical protein